MLCFRMLTVISILVFCAGLRAQSDLGQDFARALGDAQQFNFFTIPNHSASFMGMPAREAAIDIDAAFYNPAALSWLENGAHVSINNQALRQRSTITNDYANLNQTPTTYDGEISTPVFPDLYYVRKKDNQAWHLAFIPVAGGGNASYEGLGVAERAVSDIVPMLRTVLETVDQNTLAGSGVDPGYRQITGYSLDFESEGLASFLGLQGGWSRALNERFSISLAGRLIYARIDFDGQFRDLEIDVPTYGGLQNPADYLFFVADRSDAFSRLILQTTGELITSLAGDRVIDAYRDGWGITPILSMHFAPSQRWYLGMKYEHETRLDLETTVKNGMDGGGVFIEGEKVRSDLPAVLSMGAQYNFERGRVGFGGRLIFNSQADFNGREVHVEDDYHELALSAEWDVNELISISGGVTSANWSLAPQYQSEVDFWTDARTATLGAKYRFSDRYTIRGGFLYTDFEAEDLEFEHQPFIGEAARTINQMDKDAAIFAIGLDIRL